MLPTQQGRQTDRKSVRHVRSGQEVYQDFFWAGGKKSVTTTLLTVQDDGGERADSFSNIIVCLAHIVPFMGKAYVD